MKYTRDDIIRLLEGYRDMKRTVMQLQFELKHRRVILNSDEVIRLMTFSQLDGEHTAGVHIGHISDKTAQIAMNYSDAFCRLYSDYREDVRGELARTELEVARLEHYISLLDEKQSAVLRALYFEGTTWREAQEKLKISAYSLPKYRNEGIGKLTEMYNKISGAMQ